MRHFIKGGALVLKGRALVLALVLGAVLGSRPTLASAATLTCDATVLQGVAPSATTVTGATTVSAGPQPLPHPAFCDVTGYVTTTSRGPNQVNFELALPDPSAWNGKFMFFGNGAFAGSIQIPPVYGTALGYATAATDTGHQGSDLDGSWALNNPAKQEDFSFRGVHVTTVASQALTASYYETAVVHRYFNGCSDGGREAMVEAEVYPDDFDGIIAGDPALGNEIAGFNWNDKALFKTPKSWLPPAKLTLINNAVLNNCDAADGVTDGLIQDPRVCTFDPASLQCPDSENAEKAFKDPACLSKKQIVAIRKIYQGATTNTGVQIYPGFTKSDPAGGATDDGWDAWISGFVTPKLPAPADGEPWGEPPASFATAPAQWTFQDQYMKYFVFSDPAYNSLRFNINNPVNLKMLETEDKLGGGDGVNPDLTQFLITNGGKLIMYHGWSDPALTPLETVQYYGNMVGETFGGDQSTAKDSARLFMVPGMHHCGGGPGPQINFLVWTLYLDGWVAGGSAPDSIVATSLTGTRTMPLCAYPETAQYLGGNVNLASSWDCK
jgi:hypothetical protein